MPPASLAEPVWYFAYGSNMDESLFRERRHMIWRDVRVGRLDDYRLAFTRRGGRHPGLSAPANVIPAPGDSVYGVLYLLPLSKFARLDNSEGKQYQYLWTRVVDSQGARLWAVTYKADQATAAEACPSRNYLNLIRKAARNRGLPAEYISLLDRTEARE